MPKTSILIELDIADEENRRAAEIMLQSMEVIYANQCADLECEVRKIDPSEMLLDIGATVQMVKSRAVRCRQQAQADICMYVATRNLVVDWDRRSYELLAYVSATVSDRSVLSAVVHTRSGPIPPGALQLVQSEFKKLKELNDPVELTGQEVQIVQRLNKAFGAAVDLAEEIFERKASNLQ